MVWRYVFYVALKWILKKLIKAFLSVVGVVLGKVLPLVYHALLFDAARKIMIFRWLLYVRLLSFALAANE